MNVDERRTTSDGAESANQPAVVYEPAPDETATRAVVAAVSTALDVSETELAPIYGAVDPDALDALFRSSDGLTTPAGRGHVVFEYEACRVRVESDGRVRVY